MSLLIQLYYFGCAQTIDYMKWGRERLMFGVSNFIMELKSDLKGVETWL